MTSNLFDNAKFGDMFLTIENKQAVFLRFSKNAEYEFAILYVEGWGNVQVFRHNGKEVFNDAAHNIISKQEEPVSEDLEDVCEQLAENARKHKAETSSPFFCPTDYKQGVIDGAKWQKEQMQSTIELAEDHAMLAGMNKMEQEILKQAVETTFNVSLPWGVYDKLKAKGCKNGDKLLIIKKK